jgi:hypothetical protein
MTHEEALALLGDHAQGRLQGERHAALAAHLEGCPVCRQWLEDWRLFGAALPAATAHPDSERLALWAADPDRLDPAAWAEVESHLALCRDCAHLVRRTEQALAEARGERGAGTGRALRFWSGRGAAAGEAPPRPEAASARPRSPWLPALAAAAALAAVSLGALWLARAGRVPAGPVPYVALTGTLRGEESRLVLGAGDRLAMLGLAVPARLKTAATSPLSLELTRRGTVAWRTRLAADAVADAAATGRPLVLAVPSARLPPGEYTLRLLNGEGAVLLERSFTAERE